MIWASAYDSGRLNELLSGLFVVVFGATALASAQDAEIVGDIYDGPAPQPMVESVTEEPAERLSRCPIKATAVHNQNHRRIVLQRVTLLQATFAEPSPANALPPEDVGVQFWPGEGSWHAKDISEEADETKAMETCSGAQT